MSGNLKRTDGGGKWAPGQGSEGADGEQSASDRLIAELLKDGRMTREQAEEAVRGIFGNETGILRRSQADANDRDELALRGMEGFLASDEMAAIDPAEYVGDLDSEGAKAFADKGSRDAQYDALEKLKGLSSPEITAEERFMMEVARREQERDMRASREAALRDLASRGVRSGAAEFAASSSAAQQTANNRLLADLGAQANAQKRALQATESYGGLATDISAQSFDERYKTGTAADVIGRFNNQLRTDYNNERQRFALEQQEKRYGRRRDVTDRRLDANTSAWGRARDVADFGARGSGQLVTALTGNQVNDALKVALGQEEAEKARKAIAGGGGEGFNITRPGTWGSLFGI